MLLKCLGTRWGGLLHSLGFDALQFEKGANCQSTCSFRKLLLVVYIKRNGTGNIPIYIYTRERLLNANNENEMSFKHSTNDLLAKKMQFPEFAVQGPTTRSA